MENFLRDLKSHPDFVAIALLALILGLARTAGISSVESLRANLQRPPAIEQIVPDLPMKFDIRVSKPVPDSDRDLTCFFSSY